MGKKSDFLICNKCDKSYHPNCIDPNLIMKYVNRFKWYCSNCKSCQNCNGNIKENLTKCFTCDRSYHEKCKKFTKINEKNICVDCINCKNCKKNLPLLTSSMQNELLSIKGFRVCEDCWKYYKNVRTLFILLFRNITARNV